MQSIIGRSVTRQDARLKVTGAAKYCAEFALPNMAYAVLVTAPIGLGTIRALDVAASRAASIYRNLVELLQRRGKRKTEQNSNSVRSLFGYSGRALAITNH